MNAALIIEQIAGQIAMQVNEGLEEFAERINAQEGWIIEESTEGSNSVRRTEGVRLSEAELSEAVGLARQWSEW